MSLLPGAERSPLAPRYAFLRPKNPFPNVEETMSLAIEIDRVEQVLLADGWHALTDASFAVDDCVFTEGNTGDAFVEKKVRARLGGGQGPGAASKAAKWEELGPEGGTFSVGCPLTAILAVKWGTS